MEITVPEIEAQIPSEGINTNLLVQQTIYIYSYLSFVI